MDRLPPIDGAFGRFRLPMSEASAAVLAEAMLGPADEGERKELAGAIALDPPLALWIVCRAWSCDRTEIDSLRAAAGWIEQHAAGSFAPLTQDTDTVAASNDSDSIRRSFAEMAASGVLAAELAAQFAESDEESLREASRLAALVSNYLQWFGTSSAEDSEAARVLLPPWLRATFSDLEDPSAPQPSTVVRYVAEALARIEDRTPSKPQSKARPKPDARRAAEFRKQWLAAVPGAGRQLSRLVKRLARLEELEKHFNETLEREKLAAMAELAAGAGHEINPPLTIISGRAQLFLQDEHDPERRRALAVINRQALRVHEMIADMMLFARPESPRPEAVDLAPLLETICGELAQTATQRQVTVSIHQVDTQLIVHADPVQLAVAIKVLCLNSLEAVAPGGRVEITVRLASGDAKATVAAKNLYPSGPSAADQAESANSETPDRTRPAQEVCITVSDDGPGIPPEIRRHIFDPFYSGRAAGRGLGFGLSKCWRIVTNHGGRVDVESRTGEGAIFRITLPIGGPHEAALESPT